MASSGPTAHRQSRLCQPNSSSPATAAAFFPPSPEPVAWSRCCSWPGLIRPPLPKLRPSMGVHGPEDAAAAANELPADPIGLLPVDPLLGSAMKKKRRE